MRYYEDLDTIHGQSQDAVVPMRKGGDAVRRSISDVTHLRRTPKSPGEPVYAYPDKALKRQSSRSSAYMPPEGEGEEQHPVDTPSSPPPPRVPPPPPLSPSTPAPAPTGHSALAPPEHDERGGETPQGAAGNRGHGRAVCRATPAKGSPQSVSQTLLLISSVLFEH